MRLIIILLLILVMIIINDTNILEKFGGYQMYQQFVPFYSSGSPNIPSIPPNTYKYPPSSGWWNNFGIPVLNGSTDLPWNNTELGVTSNMSYDLRGDPMVIPRVQMTPSGAALLSPWNNPEVYPIYNTGQGVLN